MRLWLLEASIKLAIENAYAMGVMPTAEQQAQFQAQHFQSRNNGTPRILTIDGDTAMISVQGVLTQSPDFFAMLFGNGNTTYQDIIDASLIAENDSNITNIEYNFGSPGGEFDGLFSAIDIIQNLKKPTKANIITEASSAAYALAVQSNKIEALNKASRVGNVGVVASFYVDDKKVEIASSNAPNKRPDVTTPEGKDIIRETIDPMEDLFINAIATGRNVTTEKVKADFGKGATILAETALSNGMIDSIKSTKSATPATPTPLKSINSLETKTMKLSELKIQHPDVYAEAMQIGAEAERDRVNAHLTMGQASGDMVTALAAVADGSLMTSTLQAKYMTAGMNRKDIQDRQDEDDSANPGDVENSNIGATGSDVATLVENNMGIGA